jgi:hypothetical protein
VLVPRMSGRTKFADASTSILRCWLYLGQSLRMWFLVSGVALSQGQVDGSGDSGMNDLRNSPVYAWPVLHWRTLPNTSRLPFRSRKCLVGLREGGILFETANLPVLGVVDHSFHQIFVVELLDLRLALDLVVLKGISQGRAVASLASVCYV